ncbi:MAG: hypothetical protein ETSY1_07045 [Candidatus Entotheonella factor]|uniref:Uncharacterized protein n=1 Tax=Entotheonella factor TaxID=1429438 RepID=W4LU04_ENTF1|nr:MAG: hypothetical protein ETSY1_07045 [Candidatus Entotheonella factor]
MSGYQPVHLTDWQPLSQHTGALIRLLNIVEKENRFRFVVAIFSDTAYRNQMIARLEKLVSENQCLDIEAEHDFFEVLNQLYHLPSNTALVHLLGASAWLQDSSRATDLLHGLNYQREQVAANCPFVIVLWLYDSQVRDLAQNAPDMWAWRAAVLDFSLPLEPEAILSQREIVKEKIVSIQADSHERQRRLADIEAYLSKQPKRYASDAALLREMSRIYMVFGDITQAEKSARIAYDISHEYDDKQGCAMAVGFLADVFMIRGDLDEALRMRTEEELPIYERLGDARSLVVTKGKIADILQLRSDLDEALRIRTEEELPVYEQLGDVRSLAVTKGKIADILQLRGELDEALRILTEDQLPVYERLSDVREVAVTQGKIADILQLRGELDEALRIRTEEELPVYERLGEVNSIAVTKGQIADILQLRGNLDEALRMRREEELPVYERLGEVRSIAITKSKIADILQLRGNLDEALRMRREEELPVYERLGDVRLIAVAKGKIADILQLRGDLDEALRIRLEDQLPVYEQLGEVRSIAIARSKIADILQLRGDLEEALRMRTEEELPIFERLGEARSIAVTKGKIANIMQRRGDLNEALRIRLEDQLPVYERLGDMHEIAVTLHSLFDLYWEAQEFQNAYEVISKAFTIVMQLGIADGISMVGLKLGQAMIMVNQLEEAKHVLMQSRDAAAKLGQADRVRAIDTLLDEQNKVASDT